MLEDTEIRRALRKQMAKVRGNNAWFWKQSVRRNGLTTATPVRLRGNFGTDTEDQQERLRLALLGRGYEIINTGRRAGLTETLFETPAQTWDLAAWNAWTDEMALLGAGVDFALFGGITEAVLDRDATDAVSDEKAEQRAGNAAMWKQLRAHGVAPDAIIAVEAHFWAVNEGGADRLRDRLQTDLRYSVSIDPPSRGLFRKSGPWSVTGMRPAKRLDPADIDTWSDQMVDIAATTSTRFDGWGVQLPS